MTEYNITTIAEHAVCLDLLPNHANVMDIGCRSFSFSDYFRNLGHRVFPIDIDELHEGKSYYMCAISDFDGRVGIQRSNDPQATRIKEGDTIPCYTLDTFIKSCGVKMDLIKLDVEGAEREIIMSLTKAPAKQISIEFHLHTGIYDQKAMSQMEGKLRDLGYIFAQHELTTEHGAGYSYWDSLFVLR